MNEYDDEHEYDDDDADDNAEEEEEEEEEEDDDDDDDKKLPLSSKEKCFDQLLRVNISIMTNIITATTTAHITAIL